MSPEHEPAPRWEYPWLEDGDGHYLNLRTEMGVFELRPSNTFVFVPEDPAHERLSHIYRVTEEHEDGFNGFYMWREQMAKVGKDLDVLVTELQAHGFETIEFDEIDPHDIEAWEDYHETEYTIGTKVVQSEDDIVLNATKDLDAEWRWYEGEWGNGTQGTMDR